MDPCSILSSDVALDNPSVQLFEHQKKYVTLLQILARDKQFFRAYNDVQHLVRSNFFILNSKVGSGKTMTVLCYLQSVMDNPVVNAYDLINTMHFGHTQIFCRDHTSSSTDLIVVPHTVYAQWKREIKTYFPRLQKRLVCIETSKQAKTCQRLAPNILYLVKDTMTGFMRVKTTRQGILLRNFIVDEPHIVKFKNFGVFKYNLMLWLCATPFAILRKRNSFISHFFSYYYHYNAYNLASSRNVFVNCIGFSDNYVQDCMQLAPYKESTIVCRESETLRHIHQFLPPEIAFAFFCNDQSKLRFTDENSMLEFVLRKYKVNIQNLRARVSYVENNANFDANDKEQRLARIHAQITDLEAKSNRIVTIVRDMSQNDCAVCLEPITMSKCVLPCGHVFCSMCIISLQRPLCPLCRAEFQPSDLQHVALQTDRAGVDAQNQIQIPEGREHKLLELLRLCRQLKSRVLVAVRCSKFATKLERFLGSQNFSVAQLQGQSTVIEKKKHLLENNKFQVLLLSDAKSCAGMNLQCIDHVVLYSKMKLDKQKQIIGRAWRPGRTTALQVHHLVYEYEQHHFDGNDFL